MSHRPIARPRTAAGIRPHLAGRVEVKTGLRGDRVHDALKFAREQAVGQGLETLVIPRVVCFQSVFRAEFAGRLRPVGARGV